MPEVEREYLDRYLDTQKAATDPDSPEDDFFARFCIAQILKTKDLSIDERDEGYVGGRNDGGVDGAYLFVQGKYVSDDLEPSDLQDFEGLSLSFHLIQATRSAGFTQDQIRKFEDTSRELLNPTQNIDARANQYNDAVRSSMKRFRKWWQALSSKLPKTEIIFHIATKSPDTPHPNVIDRAKGEGGNSLKSLVESLYPCTFGVAFYNAKTLLEIARTPRRTPVGLRFTPSHLASAHLGNAYAVLVNLKDYIDFLVAPNGDRRDFILEPNVRGFLGAKGVNSKIFETLTSPPPYTEEFWWLNNGVTITASNVNQGINTLTLTDARIVNGLQTSRMIYQYYKDDRTALEQDTRHVLVKVIEAQSKVARHIITTTNSQTRIDPIYLTTALDEVHDKIESSMPSFGYKYERVKNQYYDENVPRNQIITVEYLQRAIIAMFMGDPGAARGGPDKFTQKHYAKMFSPQSRPAFFGHIVQTMRLVDSYLVAHESNKNDRTNLRYYFAYDLIRSVLKRSHVQRGMIAEMKIEKMTDSLLDTSFQRVNRIYRELISTGTEPDLVGKGRDFTDRLKADSERRFPIHKATKHKIE